MRRDPRRAATALIIASLCLAALIYMNGCASFRPEFTWHRMGPPSASYVWVTVPYDALHDTCRRPKSMHNLGACVYYTPQHSTVYSFMDEATAKLRLSGDGETLWEHEMRHTRGESHQ